MRFFPLVKKHSSYLKMFLLAIMLLFDITAAYIPYKRPCQDLSPECLKKCLQLAVPTFIDGVPEYGLETLDPYYIERLDLTLPGGIVIEFTHGHAKGLRKCIVDFARFKVDTLDVQYHCNLTIKGKYVSKGRMLMFPIDGDGESTVRCNNLRIHSIIKLGSKVESDGEKYFEIKNTNITHSYDGRVSYSMTNLFRRNPEINKAMLDFMNGNWRMIAEEFGNPMVDFGVACVMKNLKRLLKIIPINKIILEPSIGL